MEKNAPWALLPIETDARLSDGESLLPSLPSISVVPLHPPAVPGLPAGAESTADLPTHSPAVQLLKLPLTAPALRSSPSSATSPRLAVFDFGMQWLPDIAEPLGVRTIFFSVFTAVSTAYPTVPACRFHGPEPSLANLKSPPAGFPSSSSISGVPAYQVADFLYISLHSDPLMARGASKLSGRQRWSPTPTQLQILESLFYQGNGTPSKERIKEIAFELSRHGPIAETNVYNWFQNRRATSKRKKTATAARKNAESGAEGESQSERKAKSKVMLPPALADTM